MPAELFATSFSYNVSVGSHSTAEHLQREIDFTLAASEGM